MGECRRTGIFRCVESVFTCSVTASQPSDEICNGQDDDCDGSIDEGEICTELCNGEDEDLDGMIDEGVLNACGLCGPVPDEICDEQDNDCDGSTDEGVQNACMTCGILPIEVCDGQDNDCDGSTDEGVLNACELCGDLPVEVCDEQDNDCDGETDENLLNACNACGPVPVETCDQFDNDCDQRIDEDYLLLGMPCTSGIGVCARTGVYVCGGDRLVCSTSLLGLSAPEICNGLDDDCDKRTDEGFDLRVDFNNCGACGSTCELRGDRCIEGICFCGSNRVTCSPTEVCRSGRCTAE